MDYVLGGILVALGVFLIVVVLLQKGKGKNKMGALSGGSSDTYFGKNQASSKEKRLELITTIAAIVFVIVAIVAYAYQVWVNKNPSTTTNSDTTTVTDNADGE